MVRLSIILLFVFSSLFAQTTYHVATDGDDSNDGLSLGNAWATWGKAFNETVVAGDTVYFHGGVYNKTLSEGDNDWYYPYRSSNGTGYSITRDGSVGNFIHYFAYPGDTPILDCGDIGEITTSSIHGIRAVGVYYVHFKGLILRNVWQRDDDDQATGWQMDAHNVIVENCVVYNIGGHGFVAWSGDSLIYRNCDAYMCVDSLTDYLPGNDGTGFYTINRDQRDPTTYYKKCRAWLCGDQGWAHNDIGYVDIDSCWSFKNGMLEGEGHGFKLGYTADSNSLDLQRKITNSLACYNRASGITMNDLKHVSQNTNAYNNTIYRNGYYAGWPYPVYGMFIYNTLSSDEAELKRVFKNNISYDNEDGSIYVGTNALYTHNNNTWDTAVTVNDYDFLSLDSTGLSGTRQSNGDLPDIDFLRLVSESDLVDAGYDFGYGDDLGYWQYEAQVPAVDPLVISTIKPYYTSGERTEAVGGGNIIDDGGGTISAKGICWTTTTNPDTSDNYTDEGAGAGSFESIMTGLDPDEKYYVRAYGINEAGISYGVNMTFRGGCIISSGSPVFSSDKIIIYDLGAYAAANALSILDDGNTVGWYIAEEKYMTKDEMDSVSQWEDINVNDNHLTASNLAQPIWGDDSITFNGTTNLMGDTFTWNQPCMMYIVMKQKTWTINEYMLSNTLTGFIGFQQRNASPQVRMVTSGGYSSNSSDFLLDTWSVIRILINGSGSFLKINGHDALTFSSASINMNGLFIGADDGLTTYANICFKEIICRKIEDSDSDETIIYNYLKDKYGL